MMTSVSQRRITITTLTLVACLVARPGEAGLPPAQEPRTVEAVTVVSPMDVHTSLDSELRGNVSEGRLIRLEDLLRPTFASLPKDSDGYLGHQAVRYVLHRLFVQQFSWYVKGLEPTSEEPPPYLVNGSQGEWVPSYLQTLLEQRLGGERQGINLRELATLGAAMEDLVRKEATEQLATVFLLHGLQPTDKIDSKIAREVLDTYLMMYVRGGNYTFLAPEEVKPELEWFSMHYTDWELTEDWLHGVEHDEGLVDGAPQSNIDFAWMSRIVGEVNQKFGSFNDRECRSLKKILMEIEDQKAGRVRLSDFYKKALFSHWQFDEKIGYLRTIGALDESDASQPRVIVPNYISSRTNCLEAGLYAVCCRNECEDLMGHLEREIASPMAKQGRISELVAVLPSDTISAPRNLSASLLGRLSDIADQNGGQIPLHGRLFAQWMHHAFPRECPYPHEAGTVSPQTPDEWMKETGHENHRLSEEEMHWIMANDTCGGDSSPCASAELSEEDMELPWTDVEELLANSNLLWANHHKKPIATKSYSPFTVIALMGLVLAAMYWEYQRIGGSKASDSAKPRGSMWSSKPESCCV